MTSREGKLEILEHFNAVAEDATELDSSGTADQPVLKFQMIINGEEHWVGLRDAGVAYDYGFVPVAMGDNVLENGVMRPITDEERAQIANYADEYSYSK